MNKILLSICALGVLSVTTPAAAQQTTTAVNSNVMGGFTFGTGNDYTPANAVVTTTLGPASWLGVPAVTQQLGVRFHQGAVQQTQASDANGVYTFAFGASPINFDYSLLTATDANILLTNLLTGQTATFNPLLIGDNSTNPQGAVQNSERLDAAFLNGLYPGIGNLGFSANVNDTYRIDLRGGGQTATAFAQIGSGAGAVPEPATWAMMLLGFGAIGVTMKRKRMPALTQVA